MLEKEMKQLDDTLTELGKFLAKEMCSDTLKDIPNRLQIAKNYNVKLQRTWGAVTSTQPLDEVEKKASDVQLKGIKSQLNTIRQKCQDSEKSPDVKEKVNAFCDQAIEIVGTIYAQLFPENGSKITEERKALLANAQQLRKSQEALLKDEKFIAALEASQTRALDVDNPYIASSVYFCYAQPHKKFKQDEDWIPNFIKNIRNHLAQAGIEHMYLSENQNYSFIKNAGKSDYVVVFGTESLLEEHNNDTNEAITTALSTLNQKRKKNKEENSYRVLPILLSGNNTLSFPSNYDMYMTTYDWTTNNYAENLRMLLERLYDVGKKDAAFHKIWDDYLAQRTFSSNSSSNQSNKKEIEFKEKPTQPTRTSSSQSTMTVLSVLSPTSISSELVNKKSDESVAGTAKTSYQLTGTPVEKTSVFNITVNSSHVEGQSKEYKETAIEKSVKEYFNQNVESDSHSKELGTLIFDLKKLADPLAQIHCLIDAYKSCKPKEASTAAFFNKSNLVYEILGNWFKEHAKLLKETYGCDVKEMTKESWCAANR